MDELMYYLDKKMFSTICDILDDDAKSKKELPINTYKIISNWQSIFDDTIETLNVAFKGIDCKNIMKCLSDFLTFLKTDYESSFKAIQNDISSGYANDLINSREKLIKCIENVLIKF